MKESVVVKYPVIKEDYINAGKASSNIKKILNELGINSQLIRKIAISSYEAEMNLVIHSCGGNIIVEIEEEKIRVRSNDCGPGISNIEQAMRPGYSTANERAREMGFGAGMGLPNMKKNSDQFNIISDQSGTKIEMIYHIK